MTYNEIKNKYKGQAAEREAMRTRLTNEVQSKQNKVQTIEREIAALRAGKWDAEAADKAQALQMQLNEAKTAAALAQEEIHKFNDGGIASEAVANMRF